MHRKTRHQPQLLIFVLVTAIAAHAGVSIITGQIKDAQGNPVNGTLVMRLPIPAQDPTTQSAIAPVPVTFSLINGQVTGGAPLYDLSTIQPSKLWYAARAYDTTGALVFYGNYYVTGATFNIGAATPTVVTTSNISFANITTPATFGLIVPNSFSTITSAVTAAVGAGSGPVVVLPTSTDTTAYTNPTGVRITNYTQKNGIDSQFFRDVSEWGRIDGRVAPNCSIQNGSNVLTCTLSAGFTGFTSADVGKLILVADVGPLTGQVAGTISVASGGTGGTPGNQGVIFNDAGDGCNTVDTMPYAYVTVNGSGVPTGNLAFTGNWYGKGCTRPPTTGTVNTVTGTVTFSGGSMVNGDLVSTITGFNSSTQVTLADNALLSAGPAAIYGTDMAATFQAACNAMNSLSPLKSGVLTFSGIALTSKGIDCISPGLTIMGVGYESLNSYGGGSTLVFAGKTTGSYVLNLAGGWGETVEGIGIRGNTQAKPYAIKLTNNNITPGNFSNPTGKLDHVWLGWEWGDVYDSQNPAVPRLQSCVFADAPIGNDDFWSFDRMYCIGADVGVDANNNQATNWHFGKVQMEYNNIGLPLIGGGEESIDDYFTEFNRVDLMNGSPNWPAGLSAHNTVISAYGGESSAKYFEGNPAGGFSNYNLTVNSSNGLGNGNSPDGIIADFSTLNTGHVIWNGPIAGLAGVTEKVKMSSANCSTDGGQGYNVQLNGVPTTSMTFAGGWSNGCLNLAQGGRWKFDNVLPLTGTTVHLNVPTNQDYVRFGDNLPLELDGNDSQVHIGSLQVNAATSPGVSNIAFNYYNTIPVGTTGSTTYTYQIDCVDGLGNEASGLSGSITNGNATLNTTNYNIIYFRPHEGCAAYNLYGTEGSGGIGLLNTTPVTVENMLAYGGAGFPNMAFYDQGQYTKNTSIVPPTATKSGALTVAGPTTLSNKVSIVDKGTCTMAAGTCGAITFPSGATYAAAPTCFATFTGTGTLAGTIKISSSTTTVTPASTTGTDTAQVNWACLGN